MLGPGILRWHEKISKRREGKPCRIGLLVSIILFYGCCIIAVDPLFPFVSFILYFNMLLPFFCIERMPYFALERRHCQLMEKAKFVSPFPPPH